MILKNNILKNLSKNKLLLLGIILTIPSFFFWSSALISYLWINFIGKYILSFPPKWQFLIFMGLPLLGFAVSLFNYFRKPTKTTRFLIITNLFFLILLIIASFV